jgi:predicted ArsR family transcriptional regulator
VVSALPADVQALLRERIDSYEQLQILLQLFQDRRDWSAHALAAHLRLSAALISEALAALVARGLVAAAREPPQPDYRYASGQHDTAVAGLASAYQEQPLGVVRMLTEQSIERVRADALRAFADAFVFRRGR